MSMQDTIYLGEENLLHVYNRFPVAFDHGEGVRLYDEDGKEYLDFCAGIAVFALGYSNERYKNALKNQIDKIIHTSNLYYSRPTAEAAQLLCNAAGLDRVFFTNSGAEAIEGAIKTARKYAYLKDGNTDHEIIAMEHSFHGRTFGALSVTGNAHYREAFQPMIGNVKFATFNDFESVASQVTEKTCAIIMETIQGEGGIYPAEDTFIKSVRELCDEKGILLILDEIQCGMGRSGSMFAYEQYGIKPDILTVAKAVGCGVPVGAFLTTQKVADASLVPGDHGSTYGGNPLAGAAVREVLKIFEEDKVVENVVEVGAYLDEQLKKIVDDFDCVVGTRGMGLMRGLIFDLDKKKPGDVSKAALANGLVVITAGTNVLRLLPPLVISKEDVDEMIVKLRKSIAE